MAFISRRLGSNSLLEKVKDPATGRWRNVVIACLGDYETPEEALAQFRDELISIENTIAEIDQRRKDNPKRAMYREDAYDRRRLSDRAYVLQPRIEALEAFLARETAEAESAT